MQCPVVMTTAPWMAFELAVYGFRGCSCSQFPLGRVYRDFLLAINRLTAGRPEGGVPGQYGVSDAHTATSYHHPLFLLTFSLSFTLSRLSFCFSPRHSKPAANEAPGAIFRPER